MGNTEYDFPGQIAKLAILKARIKELEARADEIAKPLIEALFASGQTEYSIPDVVKVNIENKTTRTISGAKLIALGVASEKIEAATTVSVSDPFVKLYPIGAAAAAKREADKAKKEGA